VKRLTLFIPIGLAVEGASLLFIVPPIAQPLWYHDFANDRSLLRIPNFSNVISTLPFLIVGGWEIWYVISVRHNAEQTVTIMRPISTI
jgi:hypothetical protein